MEPGPGGREKGDASRVERGRRKELKIKMAHHLATRNDEKRQKAHASSKEKQESSQLLGPQNSPKQKTNNGQRKL